jgi:hypothetical protein
LKNLNVIFCRKSNNVAAARNLYLAFSLAITNKLFQLDAGNFVRRQTMISIPTDVILSNSVNSYWQYVYFISFVREEKVCVIKTSVVGEARYSIRIFRRYKE